MRNQNLSCCRLVTTTLSCCRFLLLSLVACGSYPLRQTLQFTGLWLTLALAVCMCERVSVWVKTAQASLKVSLAHLTVCSESFQSESWFSIKPSKNFQMHLLTWKDWVPVRGGGGSLQRQCLWLKSCLECQKMENILPPPPKKKPPQMLKMYNQTKSSFGFRCMPLSRCD